MGKTFALSIVAFALLLIPPRLTSQTAKEANSTEVMAYFRTQLPPKQGAAVCLIGGEQPIGNIRSVRLMPYHDEYHDAWEVVMEINKRDAPAITTDSVAEANLDEKCGISINVVGAGPPIAYHTVLKGEVSYFAEIGFVIPPKPWWQPAVDFLAMNIGIIWVEAVGGPILIAGVIVVVIIRAHRERRTARTRT